MTLSAVQRNQMDYLLANRHRPGAAVIPGSRRATQRRSRVEPPLADANGRPTHYLIEQLQEYMSVAHLKSRFEKPITEWSLGVSYLTGDSTPDERTSKILKSMGKASALFDQFCVGVSVDPIRERVYVALRLVDIEEKARLPDEDTAANVMDELVYNAANSSMYIYMAHDDGEVTWCDFGAEPVRPDEQDELVCADLLEDYDDGLVLTYTYRQCFCFAARDMSNLIAGVGVQVDGEMQSKHHLSLPHRTTALDVLTQEVGHFYRSLQAPRVRNFVSDSERNKRRAASKVKRKQVKKARRK